MCGIVGYVGNQDAVPILLNGLSKLEYRGYDSAGVAIQRGEKIEIRRSVGKLINLQKSLEQKAIGGMCGIGHTRWATHGKPSEQNAHPHRSESCVLVHNGIIENYVELKQRAHAMRRGLSSHTLDTTALLPESCIKRVEAKAAGASGWIVKPATADTLLNTIKLVLR